MRVLFGFIVTAGLGALCGIGFGWMWRYGNELAGAGLGRFIVIAVFSNVAAALAAYFVVRPGGDVSGTIGTRSAGAVAVALAMVGFLVMILVASRHMRTFGSPIPTVGTHLFAWGLSLGFVQVFKDLRHGAWFGEEMPGRRTPSDTTSPKETGSGAQTFLETVPESVRSEEAAQPSPLGGSNPAGKRAHLACYDYGMGGIWVLIDAHSAEQVSRGYPELVVLERPDWMDDEQLRDLEATMHFDIDEPHGWLAELARSRR